jgi:hypothetical protein
MEFFILSLPCPIVVIAFLALMIGYVRAGQEQRLPKMRRNFARMSYGLGLALLIWAGAVIASNIIRVAYPLTFGVIGLLFILQGLAFARFKIL